jgi:hypothetical protein
VFSALSGCNKGFGFIFFWANVKSQVQYLYFYLFLQAIILHKLLQLMTLTRGDSETQPPVRMPALDAHLRISDELSKCVEGWQNSRLQTSDAP